LQQTFCVEPETLLDEWKKKKTDIPPESEKIKTDESVEMKQNDSE
jgi:hypothetical protein